MTKPAQFPPEPTRTIMKRLSTLIPRGLPAALVFVAPAGGIFAQTNAPKTTGAAPPEASAPTSDPWYFSGPKWTNYPARFYRIRSP